MATLYATLFFLIFLCRHLCSAANSITTSQFLQDPETIVSENGTFKLGFFSPPNSGNRYVGIWFNQIPVQTVLWIANRDKPMTDSSGVLRVSSDGNLQLFNGINESIWSSNTTNITTVGSSITAKLSDTGNFVLQQFNSSDRTTKPQIIWQSFDHPTNTFLPGMKPVVPSTPNQENVIFQCWKSSSDPSKGNFSIGIGTAGIPQIFAWNNRVPHWRSGPWDGNNFIGLDSGDTTLADGFVLEDNQADGTLDISFSPADTTVFIHYLVDSQGTIIENYWDDSNKSWVPGWLAPATKCEIYGTCGVFGTCNSRKSPNCRCLKGFQPKNPDEWRKENWSSGCVRKTQLQCGRQEGEQDGFLRLQTMKVPDNIQRLSAFSQDNCRIQCLNNCSCSAYAYHLNIGCMTWSKDLIDIQEFSAGGIDLYLRLASSELAEDNKDHKKTAIIASVTTIGAIIVAIFIYFLWRWMRVQGISVQRPNENKFADGIGQLELQEPPIYSFEMLRKATNNFEESHKLGQGGFGLVYKGTLDDGQEIAVKRLSRASEQGMEEFMNEVVVISKLQHRNLVRILGCCIEGHEKMLVYEYMPNKSLDAFLYDPEKQKLLSWEIRRNIIEGICRGLLYLHRDSRLRIIHRDLKASNILLDENLNPKISDFGLARIFGGNQDQASTRRVVGTYGYMSPEYAMGQFSEKSDVYSFGVILLEIISGRRNTTFHRTEQTLTLLGYAWKLWTEGTIDSFIDPEVSQPCFQADIIRCIQVGLLCVQELSKDRPSMSVVISMLDSDIEQLPHPKKPPFTEWEISSDDQHSKSSSSLNHYSMSVVQGR